MAEASKAGRIVAPIETEHRRIRAAVVKALRDAAASSYNYDEVSYYADSIERRADAIENGAGL